MTFQGHIVLIGPMGVGKTTVAELISARLGIPHLNLDLLNEDRFPLGFRYDDEFRARQQGKLQHLRYLGRFTAPLVKRLVGMYPAAVIDSGGNEFVGTTARERASLQAQVKRLGLKYIAAILPFRSIRKSRSFMAGRRRRDEFDEALLSNPSYAMLARRVFYSLGRPLETVADEIVTWVRSGVERRGGLVRVRRRP